MKLNKMTFFLKIWTLHILIFYTIIDVFYQSVDYWFLDLKIGFEFIMRCIIGPITGLIGYFDFISCVFISILLMYILIKYIKNWFFAYIISIVIPQVFLHLYFLIIMKEFRYYSFSGREWDAIPFKINYLFFVIPSMLITIGINWIVFKKAYEQK
jgi:hypothetical protein